MRLLKQRRAGEQGRGFAIVADEVRKLAEQSGESSGEIANLIAEIKADIEHTVKAMDNVNGEVQQGLDVVTKTKVSFTEILSSTTHIVSQVNQMVETTKRIAGDANEVTNAIDEIVPPQKKIQLVCKVLRLQQKNRLIPWRKLVQLRKT